jgi:hypothetical protein
MKTGRKTKYSAEMAEKAGLIAAGTPVEENIADELGIAYSTFNDWKVKHKAFAKAIENGRKKFIESKIEPSYFQQAAPHDEVLVIERRSRGKKGTMRVVERRISKDVVNVQAAEKLLKAHKPEKYGDKLQLVGGLKVAFNITKNYAPKGK